MFVASRGSRQCPLPPSLVLRLRPLVQNSSELSKFIVDIWCSASAFGWCQSLFLAKAQHKKPQALKHAKNNIQWEQRTREKKRQPRLKYNKQQLREHLPKWPKPQDNSLCGSLCGCCCCCDHLWLPPLITLPMALELVCWPACNVYIHRRPS